MINSFNCSVPQASISTASTRGHCALTAGIWNKKSKKIKEK
jgi:hypothetical protein